MTLLQSFYPTSADNVSGFGDSGAFFVLHNQVYFDATDPVHGYQVWTSNGVATTMLTDIAGGLIAGQFSTDGSEVFFTDGAGGDEQVWQTDGTAIGTTQVTTHGVSGGYAVTYSATPLVYVNTPPSGRGSDSIKLVQGYQSTPIYLRHTFALLRPRRLRFQRSQRRGFRRRRHRHDAGASAASLTMASPSLNNQFVSIADIDAGKLDYLWRGDVGQSFIVPGPQRWRNGEWRRRHRPYRPLRVSLNVDAPPQLHNVAASVSIS